jgi:hypothetical protein
MEIQTRNLKIKSVYKEVQGLGVFFEDFEYECNGKNKSVGRHKNYFMHTNKQYKLYSQ